MKACKYELVNVTTRQTYRPKRVPALIERWRYWKRRGDAVYVFCDGRPVTMGVSY